MKAQFFTAIGVFIVAAAITMVIQIITPPKEAFQNVSKFAELKVGDAVFSIETADTPAAQAHGLSDRENLPRDRGLLFRFGKSGKYDFWMKDMLFPIDFIWIREGRVVGVTENARHEAPRTIYSPPETVDMVFEINAGVVREQGIAVGDLVELLP